MKTKSVTFAELRVANNMRQVEWPGADKIDLAFRGLELAGEAGELANKVKKLVRLQRGISGTQNSREDLLAAIRDELADVVITCDLLASDLGIGLGAAVRDKFNATSDKNGLRTQMRHDSRPGTISARDLRRALERFENAACEWSVKGSYRLEDRPALEQEYTESRAALLALLGPFVEPHSITEGFATAFAESRWIEDTDAGVYDTDLTDDQTQQKE